MASVSRLNHAVLYVSDLNRSVDFYKQAFQFEEIARMGGGMAFLRASGSDNHHDLGLFEVGAAAHRPPQGSIGLYHLAWQVDTIDALAEMAGRLSEVGALVGMSDHGATKSLYARDPDGIEFEVMWPVRAKTGASTSAALSPVPWNCSASWSATALALRARPGLPRELRTRASQVTPARRRRSASCRPKPTGSAKLRVSSSHSTP